MKRAGLFAAALIVGMSLTLGGVASAHSPSLEVKGAKVTGIENLGPPAEFRIFVKIRVKNLAGHRRVIRCGYDVIHVVEDFGVAKGVGRKGIPSMRTRSIRSSTIGEFMGDDENLAVVAHCHNK